MIMQRTVQTSKTHELLKFNILSRKSAVLSSKAAKNDSTFEYLV
uniref:Uncharacterized protein n=1 Tax=Arundo donax TaxID=35708 RepID=A0A0A8ZLN4_ARUDO